GGHAVTSDGPPRSQTRRRARASRWLRGVSVARLFAAELVEEVVEDRFGHPPFVARQTKAHAPVRPLDYPAVPHFALFFAQGVRRRPLDPGIRHAVCSIINYDVYSLVDGCAERTGSVNPGAPAP